ncbi:MAG: PEP/pyruvate-binding domain-containing protein [Alphaproteobacteria bacterium]
MKAEPTLKWFKDIALADRPTVGGKGASLGELTRAGINVPPGFVVPVATFEMFLGAIDPHGKIRRSIDGLQGTDLAALSAAAGEIRGRITSERMPPEIEDGIANAYRDIATGERDVPVAVRSSATSEDSEDASFAGLQDTYLWVRGAADVLEHVRKCWASLYNTESVTYRHRLKLPEDQVAMAVVVQRMALARSAGVMFTRSPTTGDRSIIVIESSWGLGSALVSGEVTPDRFVVNKVTSEITHRTVSQKLIRHSPDLPKGGVYEEEVPHDQQTQPSLLDHEIAELAATAKNIERHYGRAQDIEWAVADESGKSVIYLLQSRPETVWSSKDAAPVAKPKATAFDHVFAALSHRKS